MHRSRVMPESARQLARIAVVRNPRSGSAVETATLEQALGDAGITASILDMPDGADARRWLDRHRRPTTTCIAAAGGDGTVSAVAAGVARAGKTLAVIPTGTLNHFARDAGHSDRARSGGRADSHRRARARRRRRRQRSASSSTTSASAAIRGWCTSATRLERERPIAAGWRRRSPSRKTWWRLRKLTAMLADRWPRADPPQSIHRRRQRQLCAVGTSLGQARRDFGWPAVALRGALDADVSARCRCRFARWLGRLEALRAVRNLLRASEITARFCGIPASHARHRRRGARARVAAAVHDSAARALRVAGAAP